MDDETINDQPSGEQWCLVGNIIEERSYGVGGLEKRPGTKHFSPGAKVYCLPAQWGDGYDQLVVIGQHRGSKKLRTMIIRSEWITNWRSKIIYHPEVLRRLKMAVETYKYNWENLGHVESYVQQLLVMEDGRR